VQLRFHIRVGNREHSAYEPRDREPLLTVRDVAKRLSLSEPTIRRYIRTGRLRPVRLGRAVRFTQDEVARLVRQSTDHIQNETRWTDRVSSKSVDWSDRRDRA
jgi:excisionase family DNA binding protein